MIVPSYDYLERYAKEHNIAYNSREELVTNEEINKFMYGRIEMKQADFTNYEKIKRFTILTAPFTLESGELTNTLKLKRKVIVEHYAEIIDKMYE